MKYDEYMIDMRNGRAVRKYLVVPGRVIWFRDEHPKGAIKTEMIEHYPGNDTNGAGAYAIFKAVVLDADGNILGEAHKYQNKSGFGDYLEKAETGAVGRALALAGFGTQFALADIGGDEDGERIADSPMPPNGIRQAQEQAAQARRSAPVPVATMARREADEDGPFGEHAAPLRPAQAPQQAAPARDASKDYKGIPYGDWCKMLFEQIGARPSGKEAANRILLSTVEDYTSDAEYQKGSGKFPKPSLIETVITRIKAEEESGEA